MKYKILTSREKKRVLQQIEKQWGCDGEHIAGFVFLLTGKQDLYLATRDIFDIDMKKLRINSMGLYFADLRESIPRLSIEGSQHIGPFAKKNIIELDQKEAIAWLKGSDVEHKQGDWSDYVIIKHESDFLGCGKYKPEEQRILNFVPKARRLPIGALKDEEEAEAEKLEE
jgi:NOL1/NOP2/fmu family ribosome biogenesis protein